jgi:predicted dehydrogenase
LLDAGRHSPWLSFQGVFSRDAANTAEIVSTYGGRAYLSFGELLADAAVEAVLLPTPHFLHHAQALQVLAAGKHVFVEKPIATTVEQALEMQDAARRAQRVLAVGQQGRRTGAARKARALIDSGEIGRLVHLVAIQGFPSAFGWEADNWRRDPDRLPAGPLDELGVHYFDLMRYLAGPITRVMGWTVNDVTPGSAPDAATAVFQFASGAIGTYTTHFVSVGVSQLGLYGTKGALHLNRFGQELLHQPIVDTQTAKQAGTSTQPVAFDGPLPFTTALTEQLEDFACCIRQGGVPEVGAREGIAALRVSRAVVESARTGRAVDLPVETN